MKNGNERKYLVNLLIFFLCVCSPQKSLSQENVQENTRTLAWVDLGFGMVAGNNIAGFAIIRNAQYESGFGLLGFRYFNARDISIHTGYSNYFDNIYEMSFLYGYSYNFGIFKLSASAGIGALWGEERRSGQRNNFNVITLPIQGISTIQPVPYFGIGLMVLSSVNSKSTVTGTLLVLQIGRLW